MTNPVNTVGTGATLLLHYKLSSPNGMEIESTFEDEPIEITLGQGALAWNLENCLLGLPPHERHVFMLEPAQAFGCFDERLIQRLPRADFPADTTLAPRMVMEFQLPNGNQHARYHPRNRRRGSCGRLQPSPKRLSGAL